MAKKYLRTSQHKKFSSRPAAERFLDRKIKAGYSAEGPYEVGTYPRERYEVRWTARGNPGTTIRGWVKAKAVKIVRNKRGQAVAVKIKT